ncbi:MAG: glycoside hydrolase family 15 protein [Candidatus Doudnabacteria bacterium]|nr:glycoside hydrolase family 15 protein [Candidatus Doudnabacteria bacterium]
MSKSLALGNGNLLICYDEYGQIRELYYPYVGLENHLAGKFIHKVGLFVDGAMYWLDNPIWQVAVTYKGSNMMGEVKVTSEHLHIEVVFNDVVYNEKTIYIRQVKLTNLAEHTREVKVYFNHQFEIYESHRGDTAYYDPSHHVLVHYKGRRVFLFNATVNNRPFEDYSVGIFGIEGKEGTFKDAEDGKLEKNPIEHGLVDSVLGVTLQLLPHKAQTVNYWMCIGKYVNEALELNKYVINRTPDYLLETASEYWEAWSHTHTPSSKLLSPQLLDLYQKSLIVIRTHVDNRGAIIASADSDLLKYGRDTYSYHWPRDAAFTAMALADSGYHNIAARFLDFSNETISDSGYFMHKYRADRSLGSSWHPWVRGDKFQLPIQEDETALVLIALHNYYQNSKDLEYVEEIYNSLMKKAAHFLIDYRYPDLKLPQPSYDLWEERYAVHTFTASAVYGALMAAASLAEVLGKETRFAEYTTAAAEIKQAILEHLLNEEEGLFYRSLSYSDGNIEYDQIQDISAVYGVYRFGVLDVHDPLLAKVITNTFDRLGCKCGVGGMPRYENDNYYRVSHEVPGNPWIVTTLWKAQYLISTAKSIDDLQPAIEILEWVNNWAGPGSLLPEQLHPQTGAHLSATPLTWSHAEYIKTVNDFIQKEKSLSPDYA